MSKKRAIHEVNLEIIEKIRNNIKELSKQNLNEKELEEIKEDILRIHQNLEAFESSSSEKLLNEGYKSNIEYVKTSSDECDNFYIRKKIVIKNTSETPTFFRWLFNNKEL